MTQFGDLIHRLRRGKGFTLEQTAQKLGSYKSYVWGIEQGTVNPPSIKFIRKFARLFQYDERDMIRMAYVDKAPLPIRDEIRTAILTPQTLMVPLLNSIATGYPTRIGSDGHLEPNIDPVNVSSPATPQALCAIIVCDDSMAREEQPSYPRGSLVFLGPSEGDSPYGIGYVVHSTHGRRSARLCAVEDCKEGIVRLEALNRAFPPLTLPQDEIDLFLSVVGTTTSLERQTNKGEVVL